MRKLYSSIRSCLSHTRIAFILFSALGFSCLTAQAQPCWEPYSVYQISPSGNLCSPQNATLRAEFYYSGSSIYGEFRWYTSDTDPTPVHTGYITTDYGQLTSDYTVYADNGVSMWVSFYNYYTGCETYRYPYYFNVSPSPDISQNYATQCRYDVAKIQLNSTTSGVTFQLYKLYYYYDPNYGWVTDFQLEQSNSTGYFEIAGFNSAQDQYMYYAKVYQPYGCSTPYYYPIYFDITDAAPPAITGNTSINAGTSTSLYASGRAYDFKWYLNGVFIYQGYVYTTPTNLSPGNYTYQVQGLSADGSCLSDMAMVTVTVNLPAIAYTPLFNSGNFIKTIDLSKPVGTVSGAVGTTATGGATYSIPIYAPPGTNGIQPSVSISYSSQSGNGNVGHGWSIAGLSAISRAGKNLYHNGIVTPVSYTDQDAFFMDGMRLNPISGANGANNTVYAGEVETFSTIVSNTSSSSNNPDWFKVTAKDGSIMEFGRSTDSRIITDDGQNVMLWRLNKIQDINGNYIEFKYDNGFRDSKIDEINYTGNVAVGLLPYNKIKFNYEFRTDETVSYVAGASLGSKTLLKSINVTNDGAAVKTYQFNYGFDNVTSLLKEVTETGSTGTSLNSTIFLYGDQPQNITSQSTVALTGEYDYYSGDFDADGKTDLLAARTYFDPNMNSRLHLNYSLIKDVNESSYSLLYTKALPQNTGSKVLQDKKYFNFLTADYDGDGRDDVLETNSSVENFVAHGYKRKITSVVINCTRSHNGSTGYTDFVPHSYSSPIDWLSNQYQYISEKNNFFIPGDFDGNGNQDYILILSKKRLLTYGPGGVPIYAFDYKAFITSSSTNEVNEEILNFGFGANPSPDFYAGTIAGADFVGTLDFDGDGKLEIIIIKDGQSYILNVRRISATTGYSFAASVVYTTGEVVKDNKIYPGDFNGDKNTDLLVRSNNGYWKILYSTGSSLTSVPFNFIQAPAVTGTGYIDQVYVSDFNGDGKSDILHGFRVTTGGTSTTKFSVYYNRGAMASFFHEQYSYNNFLANDLILGDFNGDGRSDLLNRYNIYAPADFISFKPFGQERMLVKITDGHNVTKEFQYKNLTDKTTYPYFYDRSISLDDPANLNPFNYVQFPIYAVSSLITPNGIGGTNTTTYTYEDAIVHRSAKGFLGFKKITTNNITADVTSVTENDINTQFAVPYTVRQTTLLTSTNAMLTESLPTTSFDNLSTSYQDKRFFQKLDKIINTDYITGVTTEKTNTYDAFGSITVNVSKVGALSGSTVNAIEAITTTTAYGIHNTPVAAKPDNITVSKTRTGSAIVNNTTSFTYFSNGLLASQTDFTGLPKAVTTSYNYNGYGNTTSALTSAMGVNSRTFNTTYDSKGRFAISKETAAGTAIAQTESATINAKWGKPLTTTTSDCQTVGFDYDGFGRLLRTDLPAGYSVNTSLHWDIQGQNVFYTLTDYPGGKPDVYTWIDVAGREIKKEVTGFNGQNLLKYTTYDAKGNVESKTNPHYSSETPITTTNTYDTYNRLATVSNSLNTITYTYNTLSGGNTEVITTDAAGQTAGKVMDAAGKTVESTDKGGTLRFVYDSRGAQTEIKHGPTIISSSTYDDYSRQTTLTDINAGTVTYDYDAYGQLIYQRDNAGNAYTMDYDDLGRQIRRNGPEGTTTNEYYNDNATGCRNNNLVRVNGFNGITKEYTYNGLQRLQSEKVTVDAGNIYETQYTYDTYGKITNTLYPSGVEVVNSYDISGYLLTVDGGSGGSLYNLFSASSVNGFGKYTSYTLGNGKTSTHTYVDGLPRQFYTPNIQDINFNFDATRSNLLSRTDNQKSMTEDFSYDNLNRLQSSIVNSTTHYDVRYDGNTTFSKGNIIAKTDAGDYVYKNDKIHATAYVTNPANPYPPIPGAPLEPEQLVSYTPFQKASVIDENPYKLYYTYGPDYQRVKGVFEHANNGVYETKYYIGDYEKQEDGNGIREIHYISGGDGLCAMIVKENGIDNFYFVYKDYLGSILTVTDIGGSVVAEQNYDAWGRNRDPNTWSYTSVPTVPAWLYRGYTGHEHLPQFALINMNGRLYDPIQGRMLSPDNYVPDLFHTQGYNRYTYAMNNPLAYTDPDGNSPLLIIAIAALAFGTGNTVAHAINGDINNFWDGLRFFGQGAVAGAAIGTGIAYGLGVPVLGTIIQGAGWAYAGATALSVTSGVVQGLITGNWNSLGNAGRIFVGNFNLDENKSFFGGVFEGVSRFSWQLIQSTIGHATAAMYNTFGAVRSVSYYGGATAIETNRANWGGFTQGSFIVGQRGIRADPNNGLFQHEYGHYIQSQIFGPLYYGKAGIPSAFSTGDHDLHPVEQDANGRAFAYFNRNVPGFAGWNFARNPIVNPNFRLGFNFYDPIDFFGIINTFVLNRNQ